MSTMKQKMNEIIMSILEVIIGILLLINPAGFTAGIIIAVGIILMIFGLVSVIRYFKAEPEEAAVKGILAKGLIALVVGAFCAFNSGWFVLTFPVLTLLYGIVVLLAGLVKIQWTVDMLRLKRKRWFLVLLSALISVVCGIVIITSPFSSTAVLWMFTGISLIVEAVFDILAAILGNKEPKDTYADSEAGN